MMKVLVLESSDDVFNMRKEILNRLKECGFEVSLACPYGKKIVYFKENNVEFINFKINRRTFNPFSLISLIVRYFFLLSRVKPDLVLTFTTIPNLLGGFVCRLRRNKYIVNVSGLGSYIYFTGLRKRFMEILYSFSLKGASHVYFQNQENYRILSSRINGISSFDVIPGSGVNLEEFSYKSISFQEEYTRRFVYIGRLMDEKGIKLFIQAAQSLHDSNQKAVFTIYGKIEDDYYKDIENMLSAYERINYKGVTNEPVEAISECTCLVLPSYYGEGMSNVLLEASAIGRPIITTDIAGCREIVRHNVNGYMVEPRNLRQLTDFMQKHISISDEELKSIGIKARSIVAKDFDREIVVKAYEDKVKVLLK